MEAGFSSCLLECGLSDYNFKYFCSQTWLHVICTTSFLSYPSRILCPSFSGLFKIRQHTERSDTTLSELSVLAFLAPTDFFSALSPDSQISAINLVRTVLLSLTEIMSKPPRKTIKVVINQSYPLRNTPLIAVYLFSECRKQHVVGGG